MIPLIYPVTICAAILFHYFPIVSADTQLIKENPLDGLKFQGQTGEQGKGDHHTDTLTFKNGEFRSLDCEEWGFDSAPYQFKRVGDLLHFSAVLPSSDRGTLKWEGTINGDLAEANFRWQHKRWYGDIDRRYWFKGTRINVE